MRYENLNAAAKVSSFKDLRKWRQERSRKMKTKDFSYTVPRAIPDLSFLHRNTSQPSLTWIGHSTFLIQMSGLNIVTDPVWASQLAMQKRLSPPGIPIADMPPTDVVLISHSHYDHLHISSLKQLASSKTLIVPVGLASKMHRKGFSSVIELKWWESATIGGVRFTFVPSQHWTRRTLTDTNTSHWGGYIIERAEGRGGYTSFVPQQAAAGEAQSQSQQQAAAGESQAYPQSASQETNNSRPVVHASPSIYFAGDSGYFDGFKTIGERFDIDIALMPIGAYEPEWFMGTQHVTPEQALQAYIDVRAKWFVPMHYGSFPLADDTPREALDRLYAEQAKLGLDESKLVVLPHGETWRLNGGGAN